MTLRFINVFKTSVLALALVIAGCGGGGNSAGNSPLDAASTNPSLSISPTTVNFSAAYGTPPPPAQSIDVAISSADAGLVIVGYPPESTPPSWLALSLDGFGTAWKLQVSITTTYLAPGTYEATVRVLIARTDESVIAYRDARVSYVVNGKLSAAPSSLIFTQITGNPAPDAQSLSLSYGGNVAHAWEASVAYDSGAGWLLLNNAAQASGTALPAVLSVSVSNGTPAGSYAARIRIAANGDTFEIPVTYAVRAPKLMVSTTSVAFEAVNGQAALPATLDLPVQTETGSAISYVSNITYGPEASSWLSTVASGAAPGTITLQPANTTLAPGRYSATVTLVPDNATAPVSISVSYTLTASRLTVIPTQAVFTVDGTTTSSAAALSRTISLGHTGAALKWSASSSVPWLALSAGTGTSGGEVTVSLVPALLNGLENGSHAPMLTFTYNGPYVSNQSVSLPIMLDLRLAKINFVAPYVAFTNTSQEVIVRGSGFNGIGTQRLLIGSGAVSNFTVVSDTEIRVIHPALAAARYRVRVENQLGLERSEADLVVVEAPTFAYASLATSLFKDRIIYDAERRAIYTNNWEYSGSGDKVERHVYTTSGWTSDALAIPKLRDIALTPDGKEIIAVSHSNLYHIDAASLSISSTTPLSAFLPSGSFYDGFTRIAMGNDGNAVVLIGYSWNYAYRYNIRTKALVRISGDLYYNPKMYASGDGSRIILGENGISSPRTLYYEVSQERFMSTTYQKPVSRITMDRTASRANLDGTVVDRTFGAQGTIAGGSIPAISPDGAIGYAYHVSASAGTLRAYNLNLPLAAGGFAEIGSGIVIPDVPGANLWMDITADGRALILVGADKLVIQPWTAPP